METSVIYENITTINTNHNQTLGSPNPLTRRHNNITLHSLPDHHPCLKTRAQTLPIDAVAPPPVKPTTIPKTRAAKRSRVKRRIKLDGFGADDGANDDGGGGFFSGCGDGPFGGGGGGGGNGGGGFYGFGSDESGAAYPADPAFDFVYEALTWFVLTNCLYFAVKRVVRIVVDGSADGGERRFR